MHKVNDLIRVISNESVVRLPGVDGRGHGEASPDLVVVLWQLREKGKVLRGPHGEPDEEEVAGAGGFQHVVDLGGVVVCGGGVPLEGPEGRVVGTEGDVVLGPSCASGVAQPNVVS